MSRADQDPPIAHALREQIVEALSDTMRDVVARLSPAARLRLLAFLHLLDRPEAALANLEIEPSGAVRLTLAMLPDDRKA
jgi:hypothetical protein